MDLQERHTELVHVVDDNWRELFNYAFRMTLDAGWATAILEETLLRAFLKLERMPNGESRLPWLLRVCHRVLQQSLPPSPELDFGMLDDIVSDDERRWLPMSSSTDPEHKFSVWERDQGCLTAVVNCLPPEERAAFALANILGFDDEAGAMVVGVGKSAFKAQLSRAQKKVTDHLTARCHFLRSGSSCRCPAQLASARAGDSNGNSNSNSNGSASGRLAPERPGAERFARMDTGPPTEDAPVREVQALFRSLPAPEAPDTVRDDIVGKLERGEWDPVLDAHAHQRASS